jgi:hypothetical protein
MDALTHDIPREIPKMVEACWHTDQYRRKSAIECYAIFQYEYSLLSNNLEADIYLSCDSRNRIVPEFIFHRLTQLGCRVLFFNKDVYSILESTNYNKQTAVQRCQVVVACLDQFYQNNDSCMKDLREAKSALAPKPIIPVFLDGDHDVWQSPDLIQLCRLKSNILISFDMSTVSDSDELYDDVMQAAVVSILNTEIDKLYQHFREITAKLSPRPANSLIQRSVEG